MKPLIVELYKILYRRTNSTMLSALLAITYVSALNVISLVGLSLLIEELVRPLRKVHRLYVFPYYLAIGAFFWLLNYWTMQPLDKLSKERKKDPYAVPIIIYTIACILTYLYIYYKDKIFKANF